MKKWMIRISTVTILAAGIYLVFMYQVGDRIINEVIDQQLAQLDQLEQNIPENNSASVENSPNIGNDTPVILSEAKNPDTVDNSPRAVSQPKVDNNTSVILSEAKNPAPLPKQPEITRDQLVEVKDKITSGDKVAIANFVMKKLTQDDIKELTNLVAGGLTLEEKRRAKEIAYSRFSGDEINTIITLYAKYIKQ